MIIIKSEENPIFLKESISSEKFIGSIDKNIIKLKSLIVDTYRKWYAVKDVKCTKHDKDLFEKIKLQAKELCNDIIENLETEKDINYEVRYEEFLKNCKLFFNNESKKMEMIEKININEINDITKFFNNVLSKIKKIEKNGNKKLVNAIYIIVNRTMNIVNTLQYNYTNSMNKVKSTDFKQGIDNKRYGNTDISVNLNNMNESDITELINKMRNETSYSSYKKMFNALCDIYNKKDIGAIKLIDLDKQNKLVFISFGKLKPMIIKAGTPLYHISKTPTHTKIEPRFKSKDNITFYASNRIYFIDKLSDPETILKEIENPQIYRHILKNDTEAYRDSEYGVWYHNALYIETDKPYPVENVTDEILNNSINKVEEKTNNDMTEEVKKPSYDDFLNNYIEKENKLLEKITSLSNISKINSSSIINSLDNLFADYLKLTDEDKIDKTTSFISILNKIINRSNNYIGIDNYMNAKQLIDNIDTDKPLNYSIYSSIKKLLI